MREVFESIGELLAVALVYTAVGLTLGVMKAAPPSASNLGILLGINLVVMGAGSWFVAHASGYGWTAGVGVAAMVGAMQLLLPRLELSLEARSGLRGMALVGILSGIAALVAAAGLVMAFGPPSVHPAEAPPLLWLPYPPGSYAWRLPVLLVAYALLQVAAVTLAREIGPPRVGGPDFGDVLVARLVSGAVWVGAVALASLSLMGRTPPIVRALTGLAVVAGLAGRAVTYLAAPADIALPRALLPAVADLLAGLLAAFLLLSSWEPEDLEPELEDEALPS